MQTLIAIAAGGAIGASLRHGVNSLFLSLAVATSLPVPTFITNVLGSFLMGIAAGLFAQHQGVPAALRLFVTTGVLGGFTTFSAFSLENALLIESGRAGIAAIYMALSVLLSVGALFAGLAIARMGQA